MRRRWSASIYSCLFTGPRSPRTYCSYVTSFPFWTPWRPSINFQIEGWTTSSSLFRRRWAASAWLFVPSMLLIVRWSGARHGGQGWQCPRAALFGEAALWKEGIVNGLSRMNLKLDLGFRFWLRLDLPYVWLELSRLKRLSRCPVPVSKMSRNFTLVKFSQLTPAWWCIVMK